MPEMCSTAEARPVCASSVVPADRFLQEIVRQLGTVGRGPPSVASVASALTTMARHELVVRMEFHQRNNKNNVLSNLKDFPCQLALRELRADGTQGPTGRCLRFRLDMVVHSVHGRHRPIDKLHILQSHPPLLLLCGETEVDVIGQKTLVLRIGRGITSFLYREHKSHGESEALFSLRVTPAEPQVAAAHPGLTVITHPFKVVTKLKATPGPVPNTAPPLPPYTNPRAPVEASACKACSAGVPISAPPPSGTVLGALGSAPSSAAPPGHVNDLPAVGSAVLLPNMGPVGGPMSYPYQIGDPYPTASCRPVVSASAVGAAPQAAVPATGATLPPFAGHFTAAHPAGLPTPFSMFTGCPAAAAQPLPPLPPGGGAQHETGHAPTPSMDSKKRPLPYPQ